VICLLKIFLVAYFLAGDRSAFWLCVAAFISALFQVWEYES
jgi:accessory gene regulator protein AgrB